MRKVVLALILLFSFVAAAPAVNVSAYDAFKGGQCEGGKQANDSAVCAGSKDNPLYGTDGIFAKITNIVAWVAGVAAIIIIIYGGIKYITSGGDAGKVNNAKDTVLYALIGIVIVIIARSIIYLMLSKLNL